MARARLCSGTRRLARRVVLAARRRRAGSFRRAGLTPTLTGYVTLSR